MITLLALLLASGPCVDYEDDYHSIITYNACPKPEPKYACPPRDEMILAVLARCGGAGPPERCTFRPDKWKTGSVIVPNGEAWDGLFEAVYEYREQTIREGGLWRYGEKIRGQNKCWPSGPRATWRVERSPGSGTLACREVRDGLRCVLSREGMWQIGARRGVGRATFLVIHR